MPFRGGGREKEVTACNYLQEKEKGASFTRRERGSNHNRCKARCYYPRQVGEKSGLNEGCSKKGEGGPQKKELVVWLKGSPVRDRSYFSGVVGTRIYGGSGEKEKLF